MELEKLVVGALSDCKERAKAILFPETRSNNNVIGFFVPTTPFLPFVDPCDFRHAIALLDDFFVVKAPSSSLWQESWAPLASFCEENRLVLALVQEEWSASFNAISQYFQLPNKKRPQVCYIHKQKLKNVWSEDFLEAFESKAFFANDLSKREQQLYQLRAFRLLEQVEELAVELSFAHRKWTELFSKYAEKAAFEGERKSLLESFQADSAPLLDLPWEELPLQKRAVFVKSLLHFQQVWHKSLMAQGRL